MFVTSAPEAMRVNREPIGASRCRVARGENHFTLRQNRDIAFRAVETLLKSNPKRVPQPQASGRTQ